MIAMPEFDPDQCYLSHEQILEVGDVLIERWKKDPKSNWKMINIVRGIKFLLRHSPHDQVEQYYRESFKIVYWMMQKNAQAGDPTLQKLPAPAPPVAVYCVSKPEPAVRIDWMSSFKRGGMKD